MTGSALVVGSSGVVGSTLVRQLSRQGWQVYGLARHPQRNIRGVVPVAADLLDASSIRAMINGVSATHVFIATWLRQQTEADNIRVNSAMVRNLLDALSARGSTRHVALVTGLK